MAECEIVPLAGIRLDPAAGASRDYTRAEGHRDAGYLDRYDRTTLIYDCVWRPDLGVYVANAPLFLNLWAPFRDGLRHDGKRVASLRRHEWKRCEQVVVPGPRGPLSVDLGGRVYDMPARDTQRDRFAGLNCLLALNRNNRIEWIVDWVRYHVERHGAEGVVLVDNGSDAYALTELADAMAAVSGLKSGVIYSAPFPYGPLSGRVNKRERLAKFFQSAMLNLARSDALSAARAVLSVDIDELVEGPEGKTIFDAAVRNPLGMVTFRGYWAYPETGAAIPTGHAAHRFRSHPIKKCNRKWCMVPTGFIARNFPWDPHQIGGILQNVFTEQDRFTHAHCFGCTTGWKRNAFDVEVHRDPALDRLMDQYFPVRDANSDDRSAAG